MSDELDAIMQRLVDDADWDVLQDCYMQLTTSGGPYWNCDHPDHQTCAKLAGRALELARVKQRPSE